MKAAQITAYGDSSVIAVNDAPKPVPGKGQVLVEVHAASLNPWDSKVREGAAQSFMPLDLPVTAGGDIAGEVVEVGQGVTGFKVGDKVYGDAGVKGGSGAFAEFAAAPIDRLAKVPSTFDFQHAAAVVLTGVSAVQALTQHIGLKAGQKILIQGGSGGIGSIAVQIAKHLGAYVATTVPTEAVVFAKELGADEVIDYKTQKFEELIQDYDAVFDTAGGEVFEKSLDVLRSGGVAVSMIATADEVHAKGRGVTAITQQTHTTTQLLDQLRDLIDARAVKVHIDKTFSLDDAAEAFRVRDAGGIKGKIVLAIRPE